MSYFYVEVKRPVNGNGKDKLVGLHDTTSKTKPEPSWGGDAVLSITELNYKILSACKGNIKALKMSINLLDDWLEGED